MKFFALLVAICITGLSACDSGRSDATLGATQRAAESGNVIITAADRPKTIEAIRNLAKDHGLVENRDSDLERIVGEAEDRPIYSAYFSRGNVMGLYFSNDIGESNFTYMIFREPFSNEQFSNFRQGVLQILNVPADRANQSEVKGVPSNNSFKPKPLRGSA